MPRVTNMATTVERRNARRLMECLGVIPGDIKEAGHIEMRGSPEGFVQEVAGKRLPEAVCSETLRPIGNSRAVGLRQDGTTAMILGGRSLVVGSFVSIAYSNTSDQGLEKFICSAAGWGGVRPAISFRRRGNTNSFVETRLLRGVAHHVAFFINHGATPVRGEVLLDLPAGDYEIRDLISVRLAIK